MYILPRTHFNMMKNSGQLNEGRQNSFLLTTLRFCDSTGTITKVSDGSHWIFFVLLYDDFFFSPGKCILLLQRNLKQKSSHKGQGNSFISTRERCNSECDIRK